MIDSSSLARVGTKWTYVLTPTYKNAQVPGEIQSDPFQVALEVTGEEDVTVPAGKFRALKVVQKVNTNEVTMYFAKGLGMVLRVGADGTRTELKEYSGVRASE
jgi:hypothetical protein